MNDPIVERQFFFRSADGNEVLTAIQIGRPLKLEEMEWSCEVEILGIEKKRGIYGVNSLQALQLAIGFLADRLDHLEQMGAVFLSSERRVPIAAGDIIAARCVSS